MAGSNVRKAEFVVKQSGVAMVKHTSFQSRLFMHINDKTRTIITADCTVSAAPVVPGSPEGYMIVEQFPLVGAQMVKVKVLIGSRQELSDFRSGKRRRISRGGLLDLIIPE